MYGATEMCRRCCNAKGYGGARCGTYATGTVNSLFERRVGAALQQIGDGDVE
jgi:hypothetical protein